MSVKHIGIFLLTGTLTGCVIINDSGNTDGGTDNSTTQNTTEAETETDTQSSETEDTTETTDTTETGTDTAAETEAETAGPTTDGTDTEATDSDTGMSGMPGCGWNVEAMYYDCTEENEGGVDPSSTYPINCPEQDLIEDAECGEVTGVGCCDAGGSLWYCDVSGDNLLATQICQ